MALMGFCFVIFVISRNAHTSYILQVIAFASAINNFTSLINIGLITNQIGSNNLFHNNKKNFNYISQATAIRNPVGIRHQL